MSGQEDTLSGQSERIQSEVPTSSATDPVSNIRNRLGPPGDTYEEEFNKLRTLVNDGDILGPAAPLVYVNTARILYRRAREITTNQSLSPYNKCVLLFQIFDALVLVYKNISFVYCDKRGAHSVYGYSESALKSLLARIEAITRQVATAVHDAHSLTVMNSVMASAEQRLSQVRSEKDMLEFFRGVSGSHNNMPSDSVTRAAGAQSPHGIEVYKDPYPNADTLLQRLHEFNSDSDYIRDFHDVMFLIATANAPGALSSALETRLADKDRNIVLLEVPGDRIFASAMCVSAIGFLRKKLNNAGGESASANVPTDEIETYRVNFGRLFSKYRGESERNFDAMMEWIKNTVRGGDKFRIFWFPDIENLMSPRTSSDQEHIAAIKNSMLQHMDTFNKDRTLRSFLLLFNSSEGSLDSAFLRRLETVVRTSPDPLTDKSIAYQTVNAELVRYHINLTDQLVLRIAENAGSADDREGSRVGGFAQVQAVLRDFYVNQKLALKYDARAIDIRNLSMDDLLFLIERYVSDIGPPETLYDLNEHPVLFSAVSTIAFTPTSKLATLFTGCTPIKYNASVQGDPKSIDERTAARTIYLHDV